MENPKTHQQKPAYGMASNCAFMVRRAWRDAKSVLVVCVGLIICAVAASLLELFVTPMILAAVERGASPGELAALIARFALGLALVHSLWAYLRANTLFGRVQVRRTLSVEHNLLECRTAYPHIEDPDYLQRLAKSGRTLSTNRDASEAVWDTMTGLVTNLVSFAIYLLLLSRAEPGIALLTAALAAVGYFAGERIRSWRYLHREEEGRLHRMSDRIVYQSQSPELAKDVRIFGLGPWLLQLYDKYTQLFFDFCAKAQRRYLWADLLDVGLALARNGAAYGWLIALALRGELSPARFVLYFSAVGGFAQWVTGIFQNLGTLHRQSLELSTLREFMAAPEPFRFEDGAPLDVKPGHLYAIELRDVSYRYPGADHDALSHVNLAIRPGEKLAVVGKNGAGKTTLIKLMCGLLAPTQGSVLLDGEDIRQYNRRDYYRLFSAVFQQFAPLPGTVAENVAQGEDVELARMWDCLDKAGVAEAVRELPQGENTHLGRQLYLDGVELSGGQMQKLMLARAMYKNGPIVVLDEPTAALDPIAESKLYQKYHELTQNSTSVYISHRLASTRFCDRVLLVEDGGIAEEGTHDSLLERGGRYAYLFDIQRKYYADSADLKGVADHE